MSAKVRWAGLLAWLVAQACVSPPVIPGSEAPFHDHDGDGSSEDQGDCNDEDAAQRPTARWYADGDGDGFGDPNAESICSPATPSDVANNDDCDDTDPDENPSATWYTDQDGDGFGDAGSSHPCERVDEADVRNSDDCDDADVDENPSSTWYADADGDGFGDDATAHPCDRLSDDDVLVGGDCDDSDPDEKPGVTWYTDADDDGFGGDSSGRVCERSASSDVTDTGDCDETNPNVNPAELDYCGNGDTNCSGDESDAVDAQTWWSDTDGDGFGDAGVPVTACAEPQGVSDRVGDCDDNDATVNPGRPEQCNTGHDDDCNNDVWECRNKGTERLGSGDCTRGDGMDYGIRGTGFGQGDLAVVDLNADNYDEILVGVPFLDSEAGAVYIYRGPELPDNAGQADAILTGVHAEDRAGASVSDGRSLAAMDIDRDGKNELFVGVPGAEEVYYFRSPETLAGTQSLATANARFTASTGTALGTWVSRVGDINGDSFADVAIASNNAVYVVTTPPTLGGDLDSVADVVIHGAVVVTYTGDVNADGFDDLLVSDPWLATLDVGNPDPTSVTGGTAWLFFGPLDGAYETGDADVVFTGGGAALVLGYLLQTVDFDGDGARDVVLANAAGTYGPSFPLELRIWFGPLAPGPRADASADLVLQARNGAIGNQVSLSSGDHDGDGIGDIAVGGADRYYVRCPEVSGYSLFYGGPRDRPTRYPDLRCDGQCYTNAYITAGHYVDLSGDVDGDSRSELAYGLVENPESWTGPPGRIHWLQGRGL